MSYQIINKTEQELESCSVHAIHIQVSDVAERIREVFRTISDTSWVKELDELASSVLGSAADRTIEKLREKVFLEDEEGNVTDELTADVGEYVISVSATHVLNGEYKHESFPLSELWKEQISGNPGFDYHSLNSKELILFGEAKFRKDQTAYSVALTDAVKLRDGEKDILDLLYLKELAGVFACTNCKNGFRVFSVAFTVNGANISAIMNNAANSAKAKKLYEHGELYLIGVEFVK